MMLPTTQEMEEELRFEQEIFPPCRSPEEKFDDLQYLPGDEDGDDEVVEDSQPPAAAAAAAMAAAATWLCHMALPYGIAIYGFAMYGIAIYGLAIYGLDIYGFATKKIRYFDQAMVSLI